MQHRKLLAQICQLTAVGPRNNAREEYSSVMTFVVVNPVNQHSTLIRKAAVCLLKASHQFYSLTCSPIPNWLKPHWYEANHAFANPTGGRYDDDVATQACVQTLTFLESHLRGSSWLCRPEQHYTRFQIAQITPLIALEESAPNVNIVPRTGS